MFAFEFNQSGLKSFLFSGVLWSLVVVLLLSPMSSQNKTGISPKAAGGVGAKIKEQALRYHHLGLLAHGLNGYTSGKVDDINLYQDYVNYSSTSPNEFIPANQDGLERAGLQSLFGQVAKTVVYGGASFARLYNRVLCPILTSSYVSSNGGQAEENEEQPTLFAFNDHLSNSRAFRIYADDEITREMVEEAGFHRDQMTFIFVHGWLGGIHNELWLSEAKDAVLQSQWRTNDFKPNVIVVDWSGFASGSLYSATRNSLKVSERLGRLLEQLVTVGGLQPELMHCFGHSIGTHICGQAARQAFPIQPRPVKSKPNLFFDQPRMGRITGLDPGGFCYELGVKNETTYTGLRPSDALLVDAYYTNRSPFGNKYQVAHYNVRINNGFFQSPCSVWRNPDIARSYFRAAVRFLFGNAGNNELLTCDHYFATKLAKQLSPIQAGTTSNSGSSYARCSFVSIACDSYRSFSRGRCGYCGPKKRGCYLMDFEYQRANPNQAHALKHLRQHAILSSSSQLNEPLGGVPYADRRIFYMRVASDTTMCSMTFRIRVGLPQSILDINGFKPDWIKLRFTNELDEQVMMRQVSTNKVTDSLILYGPWTVQNGTLSDLDYDTGIDGYTLTALFDLAATPTSPIRAVQIDCDPELTRRVGEEASLVNFVKLDYLSSLDERIREYYSRDFSSYEITTYHRKTTQ